MPSTYKFGIKMIDEVVPKKVHMRRLCFRMLCYRMFEGSYVENAHTVKSTWRCKKAKKNCMAFSSGQPLKRHVARWGTFSVDSGIVVSLYASAHHPYTTLATGEWMIIYCDPIVLLKLGQLSVATILKSGHTYVYKVATSNLTTISTN